VTREPTLIEVCIAHGGIRKGARICTFITQWTMASQAIGHEITLEEFADWWKDPRSTSYRYQQEFRECFPHLKNPQAIANLTLARLEASQHGVTGVGSLPASLIPA
jgi:hypothetical protein